MVTSGELDISTQFVSYSGMRTPHFAGWFRHSELPLLSAYSTASKGEMEIVMPV